MLLVFPPAARSSEPPLSLARLASFLRGADAGAGSREGGPPSEPVACLDLNREGIDYLLRQEATAPEGDTWTRNALRRRKTSAAAIRDPGAYESPDRYKRAVLDLGRALRAASAPFGVEASLADYRDEKLSPTRYGDLLEAARGFETNVYRPLFAERIEEELRAASLQGRPHRAVGISLGYLTQALPGFAVAGYLRAAHPELKLVLGGGLVNSWVGTGLIGPGESFGGLVDAVEAGRAEDGLPRTAAALGLGGDIGRPPRGSRAAPPDFSDFAHLSYDAPVRILPFNFSWACPWRRCSFCPERAEGARYAALPAPAAVSQLESLVARWDPGLLHFMDSEIAPLYLRALADRPPGPRWYGFARFGGVLDDPGFCRRLAKAGCAMLQLGLESADQGVLDGVGKGTDLAAIDRILGNLAEAGIASYVYVLFGTPSEDRDAALRTRDYLAEKAGLISFLNLAIFNLPAASPEAAALPTRDFYDGDLSLYRDFVHPRGWDREEVRAFIAREVAGDPAIRPIVARTPPVFTSNHAPFFIRRPSSAE